MFCLVCSVNMFFFNFLLTCRVMNGKNPQVIHFWNTRKKYPKKSGYANMHLTTQHIGLLASNCPPLSRKRGDIKSHSSVCPSLCLSVRHKNFNLGHNFCTITDRALILGMCVLCDKTFPMAACRNFDRDLWPTSLGQIFCRAGDHNSMNLLLCINLHFSSS